ncbi:MAG: 5-(carboxyamino)imidazole ribonucleotide mutase [Phycisphaerales bacterium]|jgi:5-(carboxyamino)imidazole ribonucleotide mutase|nr:5-(carboxyamino)imidazole ribonucleotide mutase [Phycisphaerales bacterium]
MTDYVTVEGAQVGVLMGSASDWPTIGKASATLTELGVTHECNVISAHRAPRRLESYCQTAESRGIQVLICAAGGAAHLAGVAAALTHLPVLGCPMKAWSTEGLDSLLSMAQMPRGIPVGTLAVGSAGAVNAALLAVSMLSLSDSDLRARYLAYRSAQSAATFPLPGAPGHPDA